MSQGPNNIRDSFMDGLHDRPETSSELNLIDDLAARLRRGNVPPALAKFLQAGAARGDDPACASFVADAVYRRGLDWSSLDPAAVSYQMMRADHSLLGDLGYDSPIEDLEGITMRELLESVLLLDVPLLASAIFASESFPALKGLMRNAGALLRYSSDLQGRVQGLVVPGSTIAVMIGQIEANGYLRNVELRAHDELPDLLGLRRKVMQLDRERHEGQQPVHGRYDPRRLLGWLRR